MSAQTRTTDDTVHISRAHFASLIGHVFGGASVGREDDEHPLPPGPWDPIIRKVAKEMFGPQPEPWRSQFDLRRLVLEAIAARHPEIFDVIGGDRFSRVALNPQPLPPRVAFLIAFTEEVIDRVVLMQEIADGITQGGQQRGIIIVGGKLSALVDELCGNNFKIRIPVPKPKHDADNRLSGLELIVAGAVFEQNAATVAHEGLRNELRHAGAKLTEVGIARLG